MAWLIFSLAIASAAVIKDIPQLGPHYRVLTVDKSENPQNLLAIYTKLNPDCTLENANAKDASVLGYYWLMDGRKYKRVNPLILAGIRKRLALRGSDEHSFSIVISDLKELDSDIADHPVHVTAHHDDDSLCALDVGLTLGPSDGFERIRLTGVHTESKKSLWPPFRKVVSVTLTGVDAKDGHFVHRTYTAKR
jgi:hypothetical protein